MSPAPAEHPGQPERATIEPIDGTWHLVHADRTLLGGRLGPATVAIERGRIAAVTPGPPRPGAHRLGEGSVLAPGFVDLQVNGGGGILLNEATDPDAFRAVARAHRAGGTTAMLATVITDAPGTIERAATLVARARRRGRSGLLGLHAEGPFISPKRPGVHPPAHVRRLGADDAASLAALAGARDTLGALLLTLAPEEIDADAIGRLAAGGVVLAAGHTEADPATLARARDSGLTGYTHLWNAMPPLAGRAPGPVGTCLADPGAWCGLIADGIHVDPVNLRLVIRCKGAGRIALVTDAMPVAGTTLERFAIGGRDVFRRAGRLTTADGVLAGADLTMTGAVRNAISLGGANLAEALVMASTTPADVIGCLDRGRIVAGAHADLVVLSAALAVTAVCVEGVWAEV